MTEPATTPVLAFALTVALAWPPHRWAEQAVRLKAVARLSELAAHGAAQVAKYAAGALRNMQVRLLELPPEELKALTPQDDKPKSMFSRESALDQARAVSLASRSGLGVLLSWRCPTSLPSLPGLRYKRISKPHASPQKQLVAQACIRSPVLTTRLALAPAPAPTSPQPVALASTGP